MILVWPCSLHAHFVCTDPGNRAFANIFSQYVIFALVAVAFSIAVAMSYDFSFLRITCWLDLSTVINFLSQPLWIYWTFLLILFLCDAWVVANKRNALQTAHLKLNRLCDIKNIVFYLAWMWKHRYSLPSYYLIRHQPSAHKWQHCT